MSNMPERRPIEQNILDVMSSWTYADPLPGAKRRPTLRVKVLGNVPRIVVNTKVEGDKNNGIIDFRTDTPTFMVICNTVRKLALGTAPRDSYQFEMKDNFVAGRQLDKDVVISTVRVGRTPEGKVYIAVLGYQRPKIQFIFGPAVQYFGEKNPNKQFHFTKAGDGSDVDEESAMYAEAFADFWQEVVPLLLVNQFDPQAKNVPKMPGAGGGGNNNYQRNGGGGGNNYSRGNNGGGSAPAPTKSFDDEFSDDGLGEWT